MALHGPVLIAVDLSDDSTEALRHGYGLAREIRTPVVVGHVIPEAYRVRVLFPHTAGLDQNAQDALRTKADDAVRAYVNDVLGDAAEDVPLSFESGSPHAGILKLADRTGAALIVMGPGPTAERVARSADRMVLVARPSPAGGAVLGASDFSDPSLPALRMAVSEAHRRGVALRLIHCLDVYSPTYLAAAGAPGPLAPVPLPDSAIAEMQAAAREQLRAAAGADSAELIVALHSPLAAIVEEADRVPTSLVVVGTHGRSGLARLALGSVAESVMRAAPCSVLVVPLRSD